MTKCRIFHVHASQYLHIYKSLSSPLDQSPRHSKNIQMKSFQSFAFSYFLIRYATPIIRYSRPGASEKIFREQYCLLTRLFLSFFPQYLNALKSRIEIPIFHFLRAFSTYMYMYIGLSPFCSATPLSIFVYSSLRNCLFLKRGSLGVPSLRNPFCSGLCCFRVSRFSISFHRRGRRKNKFFILLVKQ